MFSRNVSSLVTAALFLALPTSLWANLAIFSTSDIQRTGNLVPIRKTKIELVNEKFTTKLEAEAARVVVDYDFVNTGGADAVTVGFPVDLMPPAAEGATYNLDHWQKDGLKELRIIDGTSDLPTERTVEETLPPENRPKLAKDVAITRRWSIATVHFKARERKNIRVSYLVRCMGIDQGFDVQIPNKMSPRTFLYTFRTAAGWGTGRIRRLDITLDATYLRQNRFPLLELEPQLKDNGEGMLHSVFQSIELSRVPDLVVHYDPRAALFQMYAELHRLLRSNWHLGICGPGKLGIDSLADGNSQTVWTPEFPSSASTCIEIKPQRESYIHAIAILNGSQISAADYARHARIKKLRIEYALNTEEGRKRQVFEQTLPDSKFDDRVIRFPMALAYFLDLASGPEGIIEDLKLTTLELYPGADNGPLAISEIYVFGVNGKK